MADAARIWEVDQKVADAYRLACLAASPEMDEYGLPPAATQAGAGRSKSAVEGTKGESGSGCPNSHPG